MSQVKRVLCSGHSGSIGVHVCAHILANTDWEIVGLDSFRHKGFRERIDRMLMDHPQWKPRITDFQHDIVCPISDEMTKQIGKIDHVIHLAALSDVFFSVENPVYTIQNNVNTTLTMLEYARKVKPETFVYFSTDEVYGPARIGEAHKEWETHRPSNSYSASKAASEDICYAYWRQYNVPLIITNTMNNFGSFQGPTKFPAIVQRKLCNGETVDIHSHNGKIGTRYYIHSRNAADALLFIIEKGAERHKIGQLDEPVRYNIVGDVQLSNLELAEFIAKVMNRKLKYKLVDFHSKNPAHDLDYGLDGAKLAELGWVQPVDFEESMTDTINWQLLNKEWIDG
jgi:dTDP-glucose 4,6-dehydratase